MEIHPDAPTNPFYEELNELVNAERDHPNDYRKFGVASSLQIAEHNERKIREQLLEAQNMCLPTLNNMRNTKNILQLQERLYQTLRIHFDRLNSCIDESRTNEQGDWCFNEFTNNFENKFKPALKKILLEY